MYASFGGHKGCLRRLIAAGADLQLQDKVYEWLRTSMIVSMNGVVQRRWASGMGGEAGRAG